MNSFLCFALLFAAASAAPKPQSVPWVHSVQDEPLKPASWYGGSVSQAGYWPSFYSPSVQPTWSPYKAQQYAVPAVARADWEADPASWTDASYIPKPWTTGYYSAGLPVAKVEKQIGTIVPKKVVASAPVFGKLDQVQPVADSTPKLITYSTEITHDVPAKKEDVSPIVPAARTISIAPAQYSAWSEDAKPVAEIKPAGWSSGVKPVGWASEVKPASWSWAEPKPTSWAAWAPETRPSSWSSWSEPKPWSSYVSPVQPAFYGASWGQPVVSTNAHHAISAPWSSAYPVSWTDPIQKRSDRKPF